MSHLFVATLVAGLVMALAAALWLAPARRAERFEQVPTDPQLEALLRARASGALAKAHLERTGEAIRGDQVADVLDPMIYHVDWANASREEVDQVAGDFVLYGLQYQA